MHQIGDRAVFLKTSGPKQVNKDAIPPATVPTSRRRSLITLIINSLPCPDRVVVLAARHTTTVRTSLQTPHKDLVDDV